MKKISELAAYDEVMLKRSYIDALSNEDFKKLVTKLNMDEDELIKHTSKLEQVVIDLNNCSKCNSLEECKNETQGYFLCPKKDKNNLYFVYKACKYLNKKLKESEHLKNIYIFEIPKEIRNASLKDIYKDDKNRVELIKKVKEFYDDYLAGKNPKGFYLHGSFGSGKTYIISALFNELAKKNIKSAIIYFPEFLRSLKGTFGTNDEYNETFEYIKRIPLLLIDDIGAEKVSEWSRDEVLGTIVQYRMDEKLPTFFTSNLSMKDLETHLSTVNNTVDKVKARRVYERIKYLTDELELIGINRRK